MSVPDTGRKPAILIIGITGSDIPPASSSTTPATTNNTTDEKKALTLQWIYDCWMEERRKYIKEGGHLMIIVDACHSGAWVEYAEKKNIDDSKTEHFLSIQASVPSDCLATDG